MSDQQPNLPELLTPLEAIAYLRLDAEGGNAAERLRNLVRRQRLPVLKRGRFQRYRRSEIDAWLERVRVVRGSTQAPRRLQTR